MTTMKERVLKILDRVADDTDDAVNIILTDKRDLVVYVLTVGVETIKSKRRREKRRDIKRDIKPTFVKGVTTGSIRFSKVTADKLKQAATRLMNEWMIGGLNLGDMTKEQLLAQASSEEASARGSIRNRDFYTSLAEPLMAGQRARDYWKAPDALKMKDAIWKSTEDKRPALT